MIIYFAGATGTYKRERKVLLIGKRRLLSYFFIIEEWNMPRYQKESIEMIRTINYIMPKNKKVELFLDSGAFSAWTQGKEINIEDYISFIKEHKDVIDIYANLDVISSPKETWKNQMIMEKAGLHPLPVFHTTFEDPKWLKRYLNRGYDYIALGGMAGGTISKTQIIKQLDFVFLNLLCDQKGYPKMKVHGFGLTALSIMLRYPWYSVDSTSWVITGRMGSIFIPRYKNGRWIYDENSWKITVSNRNPNIKEAGKHIETLSPINKQILLNYIHEKGYKLGHSDFKKVDQTYKPAINERWAEKKPKNKTSKRELEIIKEPGISNKYQLRDEMNIIYFLDLEKSMPEWPWAFKRKEISSFF